MFVDSHCHLNMLDTSEQGVDAYVQAARDAEVEHMLCVSTSLDTFPQVLDCAMRFPDVSCSFGVHPTEKMTAEPSVDVLLADAERPEVVAIGETGLDYFHIQGDDLKWQQQRFRDHIAVAKSLKKPLIIHTRDAREDTIAIMKEENAAAIGGVMHCFTETLAMAEQAMALGFYISFSGIVTFKNARELKEVAKKIPADRFLIETDSPFLAPVPMRGKANQPAYVPHVAACLAELRQESVDTIARQSTENFYRLFSQINNV
ncbi:MAG: TatD family hydrolase [Pseudomonadota bacterium]